jgi:hypothetical protein
MIRALRIGSICSGVGDWLLSPYAEARRHSMMFGKHVLETNPESILLSSLLVAEREKIG